MSFNYIQNQSFQLDSNSYLSMKFNIIKLYKTALYLAVENENIEIIKLFLTNNKLDINILNILFLYRLI